MGAASAPARGPAASLPWAWRVVLGAVLLLALALDLAGQIGHLAFVLPCTLFALGLLAAPAWRRATPSAALQLPAALPLASPNASQGAGPNGEPDSTSASVLPEGATQLMPAPPPPLPGMMAVLTPEHLCSAASPAFARWLDRDRDQLVGLSVAEMLGPQAAATLVPQVEAALAGALRRLRCPHVAADGSLRWLHVELQPRIDEYGERIGCDLLAMDVTPEHRRLEKLQRSERRLRAVLARVPVAVSYTDTEHRLRYLNAAQAEWLGRPAAELKGRPLAEVLGETAFAAMAPQLKAALAGETVPLERYRIDADEQPEWQAGQHLPDRNDEGEVLGVITLYHDITARMLAVLPSGSGATGLPALADAGDNPAALAAPGDAAATAGPASAPADALATPLAPDTASPGHPVDFDLVQLIEDAVQAQAARAQAKGLELACRIDHRLPSGVRGDPVRLHQAIVLLLGLAIERTQRGEVLVDAQHSRPGELRLAVHDTAAPQPAGAVTLRAREDGDIDLILDAGTPDDGAPPAEAIPEAQAQATELVQQLGGHFGGTLHSAPASPGDDPADQGTSRWFTLPLDVADAVPPPPPPALLAQRHVLVVADNPTQRGVLDELLQAAGMRCSLAGSGDEALALLQPDTPATPLDHPVDLALIDLHLPDTDGISLAGLLRLDEHLAGLRLVLITPLSAPAELARAQALGLDAHVTKPLRRQALYAALAQALSQPEADPSARPASADAEPERDFTVHAQDNKDAPAPSAPPTLATGETVAPPLNLLPQIHARVLLAEDSGVHQVVTQSMLEALGCDFRIVSNGQQALEALRGEHFDLVLMDCAMPVLDGLATTRAIRALEAQGQRATRLPVIALTASALVSEIEPCHAAGMDEHLAKPFSRPQLAATLARWLPPQLVEQASAPGRAPEPAATDPALAQAMRQFLDALPGQVARLRHLVDAGDASGLVLAAQALLAASSEVGARSLATLCHQLEEMGQSADLTGAAERVSALEALADCIAPTLDSSPQAQAA